MKTHFGAILVAAIVTGANEAHVSRPTIPLFMAFTALVYAVCFLAVAGVAVLVGKALRSGRAADVGCSLVLAAVLANWVYAIWGAKPAPLLACLAAGAVWYLLHRYVSVLFAWPMPVFAAVFVLLMVAVLALEYAEVRQEHETLANLPAARAGAPNVLVIIVDTLRADHLGAYGYGRGTSPNIDALAKQGVLFGDAVSAAPWTLPSHTSMLTGRYPHEHGAMTTKDVYSGRYPTIAQYMSSHGYRTAAFSANTFFFSRRAGLGRGFAHFAADASTVKAMLATDRLFNTMRQWELKAGLRPDLLGRRYAADINAEALQWIQATSSAHPFFVVLNYLDVHDPYRPPEAALKKFSRGSTKLKYISDSDNFFPQMSDEDWREELDYYDAGIYPVDQQIARLTDQMERAGLLKNTILVFTSDHGESFGEHGAILHGSSLYEQQTHVPLLIRWPGHVPAGVTVERPISTASLAATVAHLATGESDPSFVLPALDALWSANPPEIWPAPRSEVAPLPLDPRFRNQFYPLHSITTANWYCVVGAGVREVFDHDDRQVAATTFDQDPQMRAFLGTGAASTAPVVATGPAGTRKVDHKTGKSGDARPAPPAVGGN